MEKVVEVNNLTRIYEPHRGLLQKNREKIHAVNGISFYIKKGEVFGLLGPNGAGKSTTIKMLTTLLAPTSGECKVLGYNTFGEEKKIRSRINFVFGGESGVYKRLSAKDNLLYFSNLYKVDKKIRNKRIDYLLNLVGLSDKSDLKVETYSKGMIQRLQIARGLINNPEIIFLDEPTIGLDPVASKELRDIVKKLSESGKTILLTTHYMYEADELCDRIAIINNGNLIALDTPHNLKKDNITTSVIELKVIHITSDKIEEINKIEGVKFVVKNKLDNYELIQIHFLNEYSVTNELLELINKIDIISIVQREILLEDVYLKLIEG